MNRILLLACMVLLTLGCPASRSRAADQVRYTGVNLAGPEFGVVGGALPGVHGTHYIYPNQPEVDYFRSKGLNTFRLCFRWERLQRTLKAAFHEVEFNRLHSFVSQTTGKGMHVILNPHNFARYAPDISTWTSMQSGSVGVVGGSAVPDDAFADLWRRLATLYRTNTLVIFGLMNEPNALPASQWVRAVNAAIAAIRATGATNLILVPGIGWTGAHTWASSGNATAMLQVADPGNNMAFEVHQYLDGDSSGGSTNIVNVNIGVSRISGFTSWLKTNHRRGFLGEFAAANSMMGGAAWQIGDEAIARMLTHIEANADVWLGWTWWAAGPWWGDYMFTLEPSMANADRPAMDVLQTYIPIPIPSLELAVADQMTFVARWGFTYQLETAPSLEGTPLWTRFGPSYPGRGTRILVPIPRGASARGFYRLVASHAP